LVFVRHYKSRLERPVSTDAHWQTDAKAVWAQEDMKNAVCLASQSRFNLDGFVKNPISALRFILRHCGVPSVRLIPQDSQALISKFLRSRLKCAFYAFINLDEQYKRRGFSTVEAPGV
jgi:hypothetical protein